MSSWLWPPCSSVLPSRQPARRHILPTTIRLLWPSSTRPLWLSKRPPRSDSSRPAPTSEDAPHSPRCRSSQPPRLFPVTGCAVSALACHAVRRRSRLTWGHSYFPCGIESVSIDHLHRLTHRSTRPGPPNLPDPSSNGRRCLRSFLAGSFCSSLKKDHSMKVTTSAGCHAATAIISSQHRRCR